MHIQFKVRRAAHSIHWFIAERLSCTEVCVGLEAAGQRLKQRSNVVSTNVTGFSFNSSREHSFQKAHLCLV